MKTALSLLQVVVVSVGVLTASHTARATSYSDVVETPDSLSFSFSGSGFQFVGGPAGLTYWTIGYIQGISQDIEKGLYGIEMVNRHGTDGPLAAVGNGSFIDFGGGSWTLNFPAVTPFGSSVISEASVPHGSVMDHYEFMITVNAAVGAVGWGDFSGSLKAEHGQARVPDAGSTMALAGLALGLLAAGHRRFGSRVR